MNTISAFWSDANAALEFLLKLTSNAPFGVWAVLVGLVIGSSVQAWLKHYLPILFPLPEFYGQWIQLPADRDAAEKEHNKANIRRQGWRDLAVQSITFAAGFFGVWLPFQQRAGMLLGIMVGFMCPYFLTALSVVMRPAWAWWKAKFKPIGS